jgi:pimeloyl-ACP methyl ester carboxylesterase
LFVACAGNPTGHPLLVIHGGPDWDHSYLREPLAELVDTHRLLLPDLRGCGRSARNLATSAYNPDAVIADLLTILDALGIAQADVLGFSYGGLLAQRLAVAAPGRLRRMIIASSSILPIPADAFADWSERQERLAKGLEISSTSTSAGPEGIRAAAFASAPTNIWRPDALPDYLQRLHAIRFSAEWDRARHEGTLQTPRIDEPIHCLSWTGVPILLLHGRQDMVFPTALADQAAALLPNAHAIVLDDAGHMAHIDQPERWLAAIERFLR